MIGMEQAYQIVSTLVWVALAGLMAVVICKQVKNRLAPERSVKAEVVDKYTSRTVDKHTGASRQQFHVVFSVDGKKKGFLVSEFSYGGYHLREKGTLKYKGDRIIDFH